MVVAGLELIILLPTSLAGTSLGFYSPLKEEAFALLSQTPGLRLKASPSVS